MRKHLSIASVPVSEQARARDFYVEVVGFSLLRESPIERGRHWVQLALPGDDTSITLVTWFETMPAGSRGTVIKTAIKPQNMNVS
jgi:catechol 2,3-dioxygenase-like lactoylglutathione lyase family enzyme